MESDFTCFESWEGKIECMGMEKAYLELQKALNVGKRGKNQFKS